MSNPIRKNSAVMKKKLFFVVAMALLLMGAFSCGKKATPLEKLVKELNAEMPMPDEEFLLTKIEYDGINVTLTYEAIDEEFAEEFISIVNEVDNSNVGREEFVDALLKGFFGHDLMDEMLKAEAGMVEVFCNKSTGSSARLEITYEEISRSNELFLMEDAEPDSEEEDVD